tara:strand:- start:122 stop:607 length:486 start_codon:yes stop_codon:yes gene_type:complete
MIKTFSNYFLVILFLIINSAYADDFNLKGIKSFYIAVEDMTAEDSASCKIDKEDITLSTKYIISNSLIDIEDKYTIDKEILWIQPTVIFSEKANVCTGVINLQAFSFNNVKNSAGYKEVSKVVSYENLMQVIERPTFYKEYYIETLEEMIKKFVVAWSKDN